MTTNIANKIKDAQRMFDAHAELNDEPEYLRPVVFESKGEIFWRAEHAQSGEMIVATIPKQILEQLGRTRQALDAL